VEATRAYTQVREQYSQASVRRTENLVNVKAPPNKRLDQTKSALAEGTAAFAGQPRRSADTC